MRKFPIRGKIAINQSEDSLTYLEDPMRTTTFIVLRVCIVIFTLAALSWLFLSRPYIRASLSGISCEPVGWNFLERPYSSIGYFEADSDEIERFANENGFNEDHYDRVSQNLHEGCNLAREDRRLYMILLTVVAATAFITLPKPKQKQTASKAEETTSKEIEPTSKGLADEENKEN